MTDISKCNNKNCKLKNKCRRYLVEADPFYQSYIEGKEVDGKCDFFWEIHKTKKI